MGRTAPGRASTRASSPGHFSQRDDPVRALEQHENLRREPLNQLVPANRELGPEKIIAMAEEIGGPVPAERATAVSQGYKKLAGCTTAVLNSRDSWSVSPVSPVMPGEPTAP